MGFGFFTSLALAAKPATLETCHQINAECSITSVGTEVRGTGAFVRFEGLYKYIPQTTCESEFDAQVLSPVANEELELQLELEVTSMTFTECWPYPITASGFPWLLSATAHEFEINTNLLSGVSVSEALSGMECAAAGNLHWRYRPNTEGVEDGPFISLIGILDQKVEPFCGTMFVYSGGSLGYEFVDVDDPELPEAEFMRISQ